MSGDDRHVERLLGLAGPRPDVSAVRAERVRAAVRSAWQHHSRRRAAKRRTMVITAAVSAAAAMLFVLARAPERAGSSSVALGESVAIVEHVGGRSARLLSEQRVRIGEQIETDDRERVALRFADGTSVRVDTRSRLRILGASAIDLEAGAVYVDTGRENGRFEVRTALAIARDLGTQFEVRLVDAQLRLRVRTGLVELGDGVQSISARPGTEILFSSSGVVSRPVAVHGADWEWTARLAPRVEMEGLSLAAFLERTAREQGWTIEYRDAVVEHEAARTILHGSVDGLSAADAVGVAVETSGLRHHLDRGVLVLSRKNAP
jgi:ferric-dicitrate binding protein FerR (iron transport regulator)